MKQNKAQGSLEYLIIIAAVLAIAAIVVLFLTGTLKSTDQGVSACKAAASRCATEKATSTAAECNYCIASCPNTGMNASGNWSNDSTKSYNNASDACMDGNPEAIYSTAE